jgi:hypothetical protein
MKNTIGKQCCLLPILFGMFVITACIIGCSGKKTGQSAEGKTEQRQENEEIVSKPNSGEADNTAPDGGLTQDVFTQLINGKYRDFKDHQSFIEFRENNIIEKWRSNRDGKYIKLSPLPGSYTISIEHKITYINVLWNNNTKEKYLILLLEDYNGASNNFFLYNSDGEPFFLGSRCDDGYYEGDYGLEADFEMRNISYTMKNIIASSSLVENGVSYTPDKININIGQAWAEGVEGDGIGEYLVFSYTDGAQRDLFISSGFVSYSKPYLFTYNSRPKKIKITTNKENFKIIQLQDTPDFQYVDIRELFIDKERMSIKGINELKMELIEVYHGTKYTDTCINSFFDIFSQ